MNGKRKYVWLMAGCLGVLVLVEYLSPKPLNWTPTFSRTDNNPYGSRLLREMLPRLLPQQPVTDHEATVYELQEADYQESDALPPRNFIFVNETFAPDTLDTQALLNYAHQGSEVFIAAASIEGLLADTLRLSMYDNWSISNQHIFNEVVDSLGLYLANPALRTPAPYYFRANSIYTHFAGADSLNTTVLGLNTLNAANFIRVRFGEGSFWLHANPLVFTNYHLLLRNNAEYIAKTLSYLPPRPTLWDEHYKPLRRTSDSPLRYMLNTEALAWAWRIGIFGLLVFVLFASKRRQRVIPVIPPPLNTSLEFAKVVGRLYFLHQDHRNLALKKTAYFMEHLRQRFNMGTSGLYPFGPESAAQAEMWAEKIAKKTGVPVEKASALLALCLAAEQAEEWNEAQLKQLSQAMEEFHEMAG